MRVYTSVLPSLHTVHDKFLNATTCMLDNNVNGLVTFYKLSCHGCDYTGLLFQPMHRIQKV